MSGADVGGRDPAVRNTQPGTTPGPGCNSGTSPDSSPGSAFSPGPGPELLAVHHVAIICSDYDASKAFYTGILGLEVIAETWRPESASWKLDLSIAGRYTIELFWFGPRPARPDRPEAIGLRHLAFVTADLDASVASLEASGVTTEPIRTDPVTGHRFTFFKDPANVPLELYES